MKMPSIGDTRIYKTIRDQRAKHGAVIDEREEDPARYADGSLVDKPDPMETEFERRLLGA